MSSLVIADVTMVDVCEGRLAPSVDIWVAGERIDAVVRAGERSHDGARVLSGAGLTALPGLINLHVHLCLDSSADPRSALVGDTREGLLLKMVEHAALTLSGGITTVRDLGCPGDLIFALRESVEAGRVPGPRIVACGEVITRTGGHGSGWLGREVDGEAAVRRAVRHQLKRGADGIKIMLTGGVLTPGTSSHHVGFSRGELVAAVEEARRENVLIAAHAQGAAGVETCIDVGIDTVEHGTYMDARWAEAMVEQGMTWVPTLSPHRCAGRARQEGKLPPLAETSPLRSTRRKENYPRSLTPEALGRFASFGKTEGLCVGVGSDAGVTFTPHFDLVTEMEMFVESGFEVSQVLHMATLGNAEILNLDGSVGSIEEGKYADLLLVSGNPLDDLSTLRELVTVIKGGEVVHRGQLGNRCGVRHRG